MINRFQIRFGQMSKLLLSNGDEKVLPGQEVEVEGYDPFNLFSWSVRKLPKCGVWKKVLR